MEQQKPVTLATPYAPPPPFKPGPVPAPLPAIRVGELLVWKGWFWTLTEANAKGQILLTLKEPTTNHALKSKLSGEKAVKSARQFKRARKVERRLAKSP